MLPFQEQNGIRQLTDVVSAANFTTNRENDIGRTLWEDWVPEALANGSLKCKPDPEIVGRGLAALQVACEIGEKGWGNSTRGKLVVELD